MTALTEVGAIPSTRSRIRLRTKLRYMLIGLAVVDSMVIAAAVLLAWDMRVTTDVWLPAVDPDDALASSAGPWIGLAWLAFLTGHGAYSRRVLGAGPDEFKVVLRGSVLAAGAVGLACYLLKVELSRGFILLTFLLGVPMLLGARFTARKVLHRLRLRGRLRQRIVAVGGVREVEDLATVLEREGHLGYDVLGACVLDTADTTGRAATVPVLGPVSETRAICDVLAVDAVLVAGGGYSSAADLRRIAWDLEGSDVDLVVVPSLTDIAGPRIHMRPVAGLPLLHLEAPQADAAGGLAKRAFDVTCAVALLVLLAPVLLTAMLSVKLADGGPVFFRQARVGRHGEDFEILKLRSMVVDAEAQLDEIRHLNHADGSLFKVREDPRRTRIGRIMRRYSIDELPQLVNVIRGEMSLVGPRPPLPEEVARYELDVRRKLLVRPGITGLWQVSGRSELSWDESVRLDLYYVDNWSMLTDLVIMLKTVKAVLTSHGAY